MKSNRRKPAKPTATRDVISREAVIESDMIPMIGRVLWSKTTTPTTAPKDRLAEPIRAKPIIGNEPIKSIQAVVLIISKKREKKSFGLADMPLRRACLVKSP